MSSNRIQFSFCVPVYNEASVLVKNLTKINKGLLEILGKGNYEIVVVDNGSSDGTTALLKKVKLSTLTKVFLAKKGHGLAIRAAMKVAKFNNFVISAIDLPFGFGDLKQALKIWNNWDIVIGSKAHPKSKIHRGLKRRVFSMIYELLLATIFDLKVHDPQGSVFMKIDKVKPYFMYCDSPSGFFYTQISIYGQLFGLRIVEVPVTLDEQIGRKSKYSILRDGTEMLRQMLWEYEKFKQIKGIQS